MINVLIDEVTPCLRDALTGEIVPTEVVRIVRKSFLRKYNENNGWFINWDSLLDQHEVYALVVEGSVDIQGLIAVTAAPDMNALFAAWMCASPDNNKLLNESVRYYGIGGHLFAIAAKLSIDYGYEGAFFGFAANEKLLNHYLTSFNGEFIGTLHPYHFAIGEESAHLILEAYDFEWTDGKI